MHCRTFVIQEFIYRVIHLDIKSRKIRDVIFPELRYFIAKILTPVNRVNPLSFLGGCRGGASAPEVAT